MWILTGILLGSLITSTHDTQESCEGRKAMLGKEKNVSSLECRLVNPSILGSYSTPLISGCLVMDIKGNCVR